MNRRAILVLRNLMVFVAISFFVGATEVHSSESHSVVAEGDGFVVTTKDVEAIRAYMKHEHKFDSSFEQHVKVALQIYLFAEEAKSIGIEPKYEGDKKGGKGLARLMPFFRAYRDYLVENYLFSDIVIESYYLTHPKWISEKEGMGYLPLDDQVKEGIRKRLMEMKKGAVMLDAFKRLMRKYHVRTIHGASS